jgi:hypothetical protein
MPEILNFTGEHVQRPGCGRSAGPLKSRLDITLRPMKQGSSWVSPRNDATLRTALRTTVVHPVGGRWSSQPFNRPRVGQAPSPGQGSSVLARHLQGRAEASGRLCTPLLGLAPSPTQLLGCLALVCPVLQGRYCCTLGMWAGGSQHGKLCSQVSNSSGRKGAAVLRMPPKVVWCRLAAACPLPAGRR